MTVQLQFSRLSCRSCVKIDHPTYITIFDGVSHLLQDVDENTLAGWDRAMSQFVEAGASSGILVDRGNGFWMEHADLWQDEGNEWFHVKGNGFGCAQLADRYILRQKTMLRLQMGKGAMKSFSEMHVLHAQAMTLATKSWPEGSLDVVEELEFVYDPDDDALMESNRAVGAPQESIKQFGTPEEVRDYFELQGGSRTFLRPVVESRQADGKVFNLLLVKNQRVAPIAAQSRLQGKTVRMD